MDANDGIELALSLAFDMQMPGIFRSFLLGVKLALFSSHETQHKILLHSAEEREMCLSAAPGNRAPGAARAWLCGGLETASPASGESSLPTCGPEIPSGCLWVSLLRQHEEEISDMK